MHEINLLQKLTLINIFNLVLSCRGIHNLVKTLHSVFMIKYILRQCTRIMYLLCENMFYKTGNKSNMSFFCHRLAAELVTLWNLNIGK